MGKGERLFMPVSRHGVLLNDLLEAVGHLCVFRQGSTLRGGERVSKTDVAALPSQGTGNSVCRFKVILFGDRGEQRRSGCKKESQRGKKRFWEAQGLGLSGPARREGKDFELPCRHSGRGPEARRGSPGEG